jgi:hypothetical protein
MGNFGGLIDGGESEKKRQIASGGRKDRNDHVAATRGEGGMK